MMIKQLDNEVFVSDMKTAEQLAELKQQGFKSVVCHRVIGEAGDFVEDESLKQAAEALGMEYLAAPVKPMQYDAKVVEAFSEQLAALPKPVLSFCRTGTRAAHMWLMCQSLSGECDLNAAKACVEAAGFGNVSDLC